MLHKLWKKIPNARIPNFHSHTEPERSREITDTDDHINLCHAQYLHLYITSIRSTASSRIYGQIPLDAIDLYGTVEYCSESIELETTRSSCISSKEAGMLASTIYEKNAERINYISFHIANKPLLLFLLLLLCCCFFGALTMAMAYIVFGRLDAYMDWQMVKFHSTVLAVAALLMDYTIFAKPQQHFIFAVFFIDCSAIFSYYITLTYVRPYISFNIVLLLLPSRYC